MRERVADAGTSRCYSSRGRVMSALGYNVPTRITHHWTQPSDTVFHSESPLALCALFWPSCSASSSHEAPCAAHDRVREMCALCARFVHERSLD